MLYEGIIRHWKPLYQENLLGKIKKQSNIFVGLLFNKYNAEFILTNAAKFLIIFLKKLSLSSF